MSRGVHSVCVIQYFDTASVLTVTSATCIKLPLPVCKQVSLTIAKWTIIAWNIIKSSWINSLL